MVGRLDDDGRPLKMGPPIGVRKSRKGAVPEGPLAAAPSATQKVVPPRGAKSRHKYIKSKSYRIFYFLYMILIPPKYRMSPPGLKVMNRMCR